MLFCEICLDDTLLQKGITILFLNLDNSTTVQATVALNYAIKPSPSLVGEPQRREYHLTAKDGDIHGQIMLLNGNILSVNSAGDIPPLLLPIAAS